MEEDLERMRQQRDDEEGNFGLELDNDPSTIEKADKIQANMRRAAKNAKDQWNYENFLEERMCPICVNNEITIADMSINELEEDED